MLTLRHFTSVALSFVLVFTSPAAQLFQLRQTNAVSNANLPVSALELSDNSKDKVSPNPEVYPEFYGKGGQKDNNKLLPLTEDDKFGGEKHSVKSLGSVITPVPDAGGTVDGASSGTTGSKTEKLLVIPVQFYDVRFDSIHNQSYFAGIMDKLRDYYEKNSGYIANVKGMTIDCTIAPVVTSTHVMSYYGSDGLYIGDDDKNVHIYEMAREAVKLLDPNFDFSKYDTDNDGVIDHLVIIHAGDGQEDTNNTDTIWSHSWCIGGYGIYSNNSDPNDDYLDGERVDGKYAYNYVCTPETGTLGVFAHEFGHDLGLPDLYDTDGFYNGYSFGAGDWDVMGSGSWDCMPGDAPGTSPANLSAWSREMLGWVEPDTITADGTYTLNYTATDNKVFKFWTNGNVGGNEYYLAEYRRKNGYDAGLPGEGLLIWHIDKQQIINTYMDNGVNSNSNRLGVALVQADGMNDLITCSNTGDSGDPFPGSTGNTAFNSFQQGMSRSNITSAFNYVDISNIKVSGNTATADYYVAASGATASPSINMPVDNALVSVLPTFSWSVVPQASSYKLQVAEDSGFTTNLKTIDINPGSDYIYRSNLLTYTLPYESMLAYSKTYYWRVSGANEQASGLVWSETKSFRTANENAILPQTPLNLNSLQTDNEIDLVWDSVPGATGYYIIADGIEYFCSTNSFIHSSLAVNSVHTYSVAAINDSACSSWSEPYTTSTTGAPVITADMTGITEGSEDGAVIIVHLTNGEFRSDGVYNKATVTLDPNELPIYVYEDDVVRRDANTLDIRLVGNCTVDYNGTLYVTLTVSKDLITTAGSADVTAEAVFTDAQRAAPAINAVATLDETFREGSENGKHITVDIENGSFISSLDPTQFQLWYLPAGVSIGTVRRIDNNTIDITLSGNSTEDYDVWQVVYVSINPTQLQPFPQRNVICYAVLPADFEEQPDAPQNISFSFSEVNAGKLMGITTDMEYSLDGGHNFNSAASSNQLLDISELNTISAANDIIVRKKAGLRDPFGMPYFININAGLPVTGVTNNDAGNTISGMDNTMEYSTDLTNWIAYTGTGTLPDLSGNIQLYIRHVAVGQNVASQYITLTFTAGSDPLPPSDPGSVIPTVTVVTEPAVPQEITDSDILLGFADIQKLINGDTARDAEITVNDSSSGISIALEAGAIKYLYENKKDLVLNYNGIRLHIPYDAISEASQLSSTDKTWVKISLQAAYLSEYDEGLRSAMLQADRNITILGNRTFNMSFKLITGSSTQSISTFSNDVSVEIALNQADLQNIDTDRLGAYYFNQSTRQWDYMGGTFNSASGCYSFTTRHFSVYSVALYLRSFTDITNHWAKSDIEKMVSRHVINGVSKDNFNPEGTITRAQFVALLVRALGVTQGTEIDMPFTDVTKGKWFYPEIGLAVKAGIISKADGVLFRPDANITREEMAVLIGRVIVMKLKTASLTETQINEKLGLFKDESMISKAARSMAAVAVSYGILNGRPGPVFAPSATTKRAEAAVMMKRLLELIQQAG